jgi:hypothetical protein
VKTDIARIQRLHFGYYVIPAGFLDAGQPLPVCGNLIEHRVGRIVFDTGFSPIDEPTRQRYALGRYSGLGAAAGSHGSALEGAWFDLRD